MTAAPAIRVLIADDQLLVELAAVVRPDVILMDLRMPVMDGVEATRRIAAAGPSAPRVLILTGADEPEELHAARVAGAAGYLTKTQSRAALTEALTGLVSLAAAFRAEAQVEPER
jgi:DNA-binding NarL/FixJ family response regulator